MGNLGYDVTVYLAAAKCALRVIRYRMAAEILSLHIRLAKICYARRTKIPRVVIGPSECHGKSGEHHNDPGK